MKRTPWFKASVKPVREGWYECLYGGAMPPKRRYFHRGKWLYCPFSVESAFGWGWDKDKDKWRGLTEQPK